VVAQEGEDAAGWSRPARTTSSGGRTAGGPERPRPLDAVHPVAQGEESDSTQSEATMADVPGRILAALRDVYDPCCEEKGISVVDMGLVRSVDLDGDRARVELLLTTGWCPFAANLVGMISERVASLPEVADARVEIVWDEPWTTERLSDDARRQLRFLPHPKEVGGDR
jgi:metal-sulfur cluster biosynthetic enzyme